MLDQQQISGTPVRSCSSCGARVEETVAFCDSCGFRLLSHNGEWRGIASDVGQEVRKLTDGWLEAYKVQPIQVEEHANIERSIAQGGYGRRQIYELVQNGADAALEAGNTTGRIVVLLTPETLYCANEGAPITIDGVGALLTSHTSKKRGSEIGRFGLGFKSVLGICDDPEFYSRSGSFAFRSQLSAQSILRVVPTAGRVPLLRLAWPIDAEEHGKSDPDLRAQMAWATTVVKLPLKKGTGKWLSEDLKNFPREFLLFSPHVGTVVLEDRAAQVRREIRMRKVGQELELEDHGQSARWRVFKTTYIPSTEARADAGELALRDSLPLMWAVPLTRSGGRGSFWAFFPTEYFTTLTGIINAPWKTNEDRQNLLTGAFNNELIKAAAKLVVESLPQLVDEQDPGRFLDLLPARGREAPQWADEALTEQVYQLAARAASLPDQLGILKQPTELNLHPVSVTRAALDAWTTYPKRPSNWCHPSVESRERRSRAERLMNLAGRPARSLTYWLEDLVQDRSAAASLAAIRAAAIMFSEGVPEAAIRNEIESARILLIADGTLAAPKQGTVFLPGDESVIVASLPLVHPAILASVEGRAALQVLGIQELDASSELEALLQATPLSRMTDRDWASCWLVARRVPVERASDLFRRQKASASTVRVRTLSGEFRPLDHVLLPGAIVPGDGYRDGRVTIDVHFHASEMPVLVELGAVPVPTLERGKCSGKWFTDYWADAVHAFTDSLRPGSRRPRVEMLGFDTTGTVGPLDPIYDLSEEGRAHFTEALLLAARGMQPWRLQHSTQAEVYPPLEVCPPPLWLAWKKGLLKTSLGYFALNECVGPALRAWANVLPIADCSDEVAHLAKLPESLEDLSEHHWRSALSAAASIASDWPFAPFYAEACRHVAAPSRIACHIGRSVGARPPGTVTVVTSRDEWEALEALDVPVVLVASKDQAAALTSSWGLLPAEQSVTTDAHAVASGPPIGVSGMFPMLDMLLDARYDSAQLVPCSALRQDVLTTSGKKSVEKEFLPVGNTLYYSDRLSDVELLDLLAAHTGVVLSSDLRQSILENRELQERRERLAAIRNKATLAEKLLEAVGAAAVRRRLPAGLTAAAMERFNPFTDERAAELALAVYGVETLFVFKSEIVRNGLEPPQIWAGTHGALSFVKKLGFPKEYSGFEQERREPVIEVYGPPNLHSLHPFQEHVTQRIRDLLRRDEKRRGLLSLPTGAGKTRVTVEALIRSLREDNLGGPILWIAQSDEICEQAVQSWSDVWRALGLQRPLQINRLWASNEADAVGDDIQVVVATIQKLQGCTKDSSYDWLAQAACVIIDEAHGSTEPSYTAVMNWLGLRRGADRCPLIGLTATPFRGNVEETARLVSRYGSNRLDEGALGDDPYRTLQNMGVLALVDHEVLAGTELLLTPEELRQLQKLGRLPSSVEERLGANVSRNEMLLESIARRPDDWPILLFAASVDHAQTMAALLSAQGIAAAAVSGHTEPRARRYYIEQFRKGKIRVLANYQVLTAGFDAPSVRAVYVARPTYSQGLYQQMIGRGLRGPLNGGKERCLIVNVEDNLLQYGGELAFRQFEYLWSD